MEDTAQTNRQPTRRPPGTPLITRYWLTVLSVLVALVLLSMGITVAAGAGDNSGGERIGFSIYGILTGTALLVGLWLLRTGRGEKPVAYVLVAVGLVAVQLLFWSILPPIAALIVLLFGVVKGGLARELRPATA